MKDITRRQFLKVGGSVALGAFFAGVTGNYLWKMFTNPGALFYDTKRKGGEKTTVNDDGFASPYKRTFGFVVPDDICAFEVSDHNIIIATDNNLYMYSLSGQLENNFSVPSDVRDIAVFNNNIYVLYASRIEVYDEKGHDVGGWQACSDDSDYCSLTVFESGVFATDASNKNVCKYNLDGTLARFINSPKGFVVPSYSFGITHIGDTVYCSNPGRHVVEVYDSKGEYLRCFGKSGREEGAFSGCCNPVQLATTNAGEILTSEKGVPRISCYGTDGKFRSVLLNDKMLGGGHSAYDMRVYKDKLIVAGGKKVQVFQYNSRSAEGTLCGNCDLDCPMKV